MVLESQAALSPPSTSRCPTANHQGPWLRHMVLSGLNPSSWFSALPTTPQPRASRKLHFFFSTNKH